VEVDDRTIYTGQDLRVGLFTDTDTDTDGEAATK
jgi:hypothetical protein